jgi:hypothetical protein
VQHVISTAVQIDPNAERSWMESDKSARVGLTPRHEIIDNIPGSRFYRCLDCASRRYAGVAEQPLNEWEIALGSGLGDRHARILMRIGSPVEKELHKGPMARADSAGERVTRVRVGRGAKMIDKMGDKLEVDVEAGADSRAQSTKQPPW